MIDEHRAKKYCSEDISKIENYDKAVADNTQTWDCHHKLEIQGKFRNSPKLLKKCGLYENVPAWQLIFLTHSEHSRLHSSGKHHSEETKQNISVAVSSALLGEKNPMYGRHLSDETKEKMSKATHGMFFWNNGIVCKRSKECPGPEWKRGRL